MILLGVQVARKLNFFIKVNKGTKFSNNLLIESVVMHMVKSTGSDIFLRKSLKLQLLNVFSLLCGYLDSCSMQ